MGSAVLPVDVATQLQNAVHEAFARESSDERELLTRLSVLADEYGREAVQQCMFDCCRIAYLRLSFKSRR